MVASGVEALKPIVQVLKTLKGGPGLAALEFADTVSGGHIKEAARTSDELFSAEVDQDTREAALMGLDLARHQRRQVIVDALRGSFCPRTVPSLLLWHCLRQQQNVGRHFLCLLMVTTLVRVRRLHMVQQ